MQEKSRRRSELKAGAVLVASLALVATILFYPWETVVVQEWTMQILDEAGHPIKDVSLREMWSDPSVEPVDHTEDLTTDAHGFVVFPTRMVKASALWRIARKAFIAIVSHQGADQPTASIIILGRCKPVADEPYYVPGRSLASQIVVRRPAVVSP